MLTTAEAGPGRSQEVSESATGVAGSRHLSPVTCGLPGRAVAGRGNRQWSWDLKPGTALWDAGFPGDARCPAPDPPPLCVTEPPCACLLPDVSGEARGTDLLSLFICFLCLKNDPLVEGEQARGVLVVP